MQQRTTGPHQASRRMKRAHLWFGLLPELLSRRTIAVCLAAIAGGWLLGAGAGLGISGMLRPTAEQGTIEPTLAAGSQEPKFSDVTVQLAQDKVDSGVTNGPPSGKKASAVSVADSVVVTTTRPAPPPQQIAKAALVGNPARSSSTAAPTSATTVTAASSGASVAGAVAAASDCDSNYSGACVPIASDVDCLGGTGDGPEYVQGPVQVIGEDRYGLDDDGDGTGCDSSSTASTPTTSAPTTSTSNSTTEPTATTTTTSESSTPPTTTSAGRECDDREDVDDEARDRDSSASSPNSEYYDQDPVHDRHPNEAESRASWDDPRESLREP
jgi:hypothetical protein